MCRGRLRAVKEAERKRSYGNVCQPTKPAMIGRGSRRGEKLRKAAAGASELADTAAGCTDETTTARLRAENRELDSIVQE